MVCRVPCCTRVLEREMSTHCNCYFKVKMQQQAMQTRPKSSQGTSSRMRSKDSLYYKPRVKAKYPRFLIEIRWVCQQFCWPTSCGWSWWIAFIVGAYSLRMGCILLTGSANCTHTHTDACTRFMSMKFNKINEKLNKIIIKQAKRTLNFYTNFN